MEEKFDYQEKIRFLPVLPLPGRVYFPRFRTPLSVVREVSVNAVRYALDNESDIFLLNQKDPEKSPTPDNLYDVGTMAHIYDSYDPEDGTLRIAIETYARGIIVEYFEADGFLKAKVRPLVDKLERPKEEIKSLIDSAISKSEEYLKNYKRVPNEVLKRISKEKDAGFIADTIAFNVPMKTEKHQKVLETIDLEKRLKLLIKLIDEEMELAKMDKEKVTKAIIDGACGRMGKMIIQTIDQADGIELVGAVEYSEHPDIGKDAGIIAGVGELGVMITGKLSDVIDDADVVIEFTTPEATLKNLNTVVDAQKAMVIATTGFTDEQLKQLHELAEQIPCVMAPNMSIGVNILLQLVRDAAKALGDDYDIEIIEAHHNQKKDSPSGTALRIAEVIADAVNRDLDEVGVYGRKGIVGKRTREEIGIHAVRGGDIVGDHTVLFAGSGERLEIVHRAQSRQTFASGAIRAAKWVVNAPKGLHDIKEVLFEE